MKYDFDEIVPRRGTDCRKWDDCCEGTLPVWIADMDFRSPSAIVDALKKRLEHNIFGYEKVPEKYYDSVISWYERRHGWSKFTKENIIPTTGVIPAYAACLKTITKPGDKVIIQTPVYNCFFPVIKYNQCIEVDNPLIYKDGTYYMDFEDLERKASDPDVKMLLLCNPQNPAGRVWTREELQKVADICLRHDVFVVSDEIHGEITRPGITYTPYCSISEEAAMHGACCSSPTKPFNLAGIQIANIIVPDPELCAKVRVTLSENEWHNVNVFGAVSLIAAYDECEDWLDEMREYVYGNYEALKEIIAESLPQVKVVDLEGTYLAWIDCTAIPHPEGYDGGLSEALESYLEKNAAVRLNTGISYGKEGEGFLRFNLAAPRSMIVEAAHRLCRGLSRLL